MLRLISNSDTVPQHRGQPVGAVCKGSRGSLEFVVTALRTTRPHSCVSSFGLIGIEGLGIASSLSNGQFIAKVISTCGHGSCVSVVGEGTRKVVALHCKHVYNRTELPSLPPVPKDFPLSLNFPDATLFVCR